MIPDFKTYLKEATWNDIRKQSAGRQGRAEDDVDILSPAEFFEYLKDNYGFMRFGVQCKHQKFAILEDFIKIPISEDTKTPKTVHLIYDHINHQVYILSNYRQYIPQLYEKIRDNFRITVNDPNHEYIHIEPFEGESSNSFCLKLIKFMMDNLDNTHKPLIYDKHMSESVWNDIRKQSAGQKERAEDDINRLNKDEFLEYLKTNYAVRDHAVMRNSAYFLTIPIMREIGIIRNIVLDFEDNAVRTRVNFFKELSDKLKNVVYRNYKTYEDMDKNQCRSIFIIPKEGKCDNKFYLNVINTILDASEYPMLTRITNESVWNDIRRQSAGAQVRSEEDVDKMDIDLFFEYLVNTYKPVQDINANLNPINYSITNFENAQKYEIYIPFELVIDYNTPRLMSLYLTYNKSKKKYTTVMLHYDLYKFNPGIEDILSNKFNVESSEGLRQIELFSKDGDVKNSEIVDLLDSLLANSEKPTLEKQTES